ncbi:hypothetical protein CALCODRAFT_26392 [Calocera cornea HHB12733]|uniref:Uncharacterized protein n=1 Tax=Calocera cornea HHB12733 TaxID=1353952 RepID=A0A165J3E6_9BASI|nr:hypothetical protein CALCODRAFT_26392 [Calocera cornea HHB12733]
MPMPSSPAGGAASGTGHDACLSPARVTPVRSFRAEMGASALRVRVGGRAEPDGTWAPPRPPPSPRARLGLHQTRRSLARKRARGERDCCCCDCWWTPDWSRTRRGDRYCSAHTGSPGRIAPPSSPSPLARPHSLTTHGLSILPAFSTPSPCGLRQPSSRDPACNVLPLFCTHKRGQLRLVGPPHPYPHPHPPTRPGYGQRLRLPAPGPSPNPRGCRRGRAVLRRLLLRGRRFCLPP